MNEILLDLCKTSNIRIRTNNEGINKCVPTLRRIDIDVSSSEEEQTIILAHEISHFFVDRAARESLLPTNLTRYQVEKNTWEVTEQVLKTFEVPYNPETFGKIKENSLKTYEGN